MNISKLHFLIYKITNLINGKIYIGKHMTIDINDSYMGSGTYLRKATKKYGIQNFKKEILFDFDNEKEMIDKERELVNEQFISNDDNYNLIIGGTGTYNRLHGNHGTNSKLLEAVKRPHIHICNPTTKSRSWTFSEKLTEDEIKAGWEYGCLSRFNYKKIVDEDGETLSISMFAHKHQLKDKALILQRLENDWTIHEIITISESYKTCKTKAEYEQSLIDKKLQTKAKQQKSKQQHLITLHQKNKQLALRYFSEFQAIGRKAFNEKYADTEHRHNIYKSFLRYVPEYQCKQMRSKRISITISGKTQSLTAWCNELKLSKFKVYAEQKSTGKAFEEIVQQHIDS